MCEVIPEVGRISRIIAQDFCRHARRQNAVMLRAFQVLTTQQCGKKISNALQILSTSGIESDRNGVANSHIISFLMTEEPSLCLQESSGYALRMT